VSRSFPVQRAPARQLSALRILLASNIQNAESTGMGKWTHCVARALEGQGHRVTCWFAEDFSAQGRLGRWSVLLYPVELAARLFRHRGEFDAAIVHEPSAFWLALMRRARVPLPLLVAMSHGVESQGFRSMLAGARGGVAEVPPGSRLKTPLLRLWQADGALRLADGVFCLSSADRQYLIESLGVRAERIAFFPNGVSLAGPTRDPNLPPGGRVLWVGGWTDDRKGRRIVPRAWRMVRSRSRDARLTLLGTNLPAELVAPDFPAEDRGSVSVIPHLAESKDVARLMAEHDVLFMPSLVEGSPLTLLEAMAVGLVPVASRTGGIPDLVTHEVEGLLFDPLQVEAGAAELTRALCDASLFFRLATNGRHRASQLTWGRVATAIENAVRDWNRGTTLSADGRR